MFTSFNDFSRAAVRARRLFLAILLQEVAMDFETAQRPHRVTALFQDAQLSFDIARKATLAQLVEQLSVLGEAHGGLPLSVDVRIAVKGRQ
jgi:hypothetical protein